jgi:hypothetical protein
MKGAYPKYCTTFILYRPLTHPYYKRVFTNENVLLQLILETEKEEANEKKREEMLSKEKEEKALELEEDQRNLFGPPVNFYHSHPLQLFAAFYQQSQHSLHALENIRQALY